MIRLTLRREDGSTSVHEYDREDILLGRADEADLHLDHESVSRRHARVVKKPDGWKVTDLGSANGVFVQRGGLPPPQRVLVDDLASGDVVCVEKFRITFEVVDGTSLKAPPPAPAGDVPAPGEGGSFAEKQFTRVTTLPSFPRPDLSALRASAPDVPANSGSRLDALLALSGSPIARLSRQDAPVTTGRPVLDVLEVDAAKPRRVVLAGEPVTFGSGAECHVRIQGLTVPRVLATVELDGGVALLKRASTGLLGPRITVDGQAVKEARLSPGHAAQVGPVRVTFLLE